MSHEHRRTSGRSQFARRLTRWGIVVTKPQVWAAPRRTMVLPTIADGWLV